MHRFIRSICGGAVLATFALAPAKIGAEVTLNVDADRLYNQAGTTLSAGGALLVLAVDTAQDGFSDPTPGFFANGNDVVVGKVSYSGFPEPFTFQLTGGVSTGDPVKLYWYPGLTTSDTPIAGSTYGQYPNLTLAPNGDSAWVVPSDTSIVGISMLTIAGGGSLSEDFGKASFTVVPEPATWGLFAGIGCLAAGAVSRRFRKKL